MYAIRSYYELDKLSDEALFSDVAWVLLDSAKLSEGIEPKDKGAFASRIATLATKALYVITSYSIHYTKLYEYL